MDPVQVNNTANALNNTNVEFNANACFSCFFLFSVSIFCLYVGSMRSLRSKSDVEKKSIEQITTKDAVMFPFIASAGLFSFYIAFKFVPIIYINYVLKAHFTFIGTISMARLLSPLFHDFFPSNLKNYCHKFIYNYSEEDKDSSSNWKLLDKNEFSVESKDLIGIGLAIVLGVWYFITGHWIANNFIGITIAILGIELIHLQKFKNAALLLSGLFVYDIFWVFGTSVMVTVAKNLDAPIKILFPKDILISGINSKNLSLLGLGDIVVPGLLVAMLLRFDKSLNRQDSRTYFFTGYIAYSVALMLTFVMMYAFKHAQPALLYLVPACLGLPLLMVFMKGDLQAMLNYEDCTSEDNSDKQIKNEKKVE